MTSKVEWKETNLHENTYKYGEFYVNYEKVSRVGSPIRHKMTCGKDFIENNKKRRVDLNSIGESFEDAKKKIIKKIDEFNSNH